MPAARLSRALLVLGLTLSSHALAGDKALAETLFNQAVELLAAGETATACDKFAASGNEDPSSGTSLNLARCWEKLGKTASAWAEYEEAARIAEVQHRKDRVQEARAKAKALKPSLSELMLRVQASVSGEKITRGATEIPQAAWGAPLPTDPGVVVITVTAPGYQTKTFQITLPAGAARQTVIIPPLEREAPAPPPDLVADAAPGPAPAPSAVTPSAQPPLPSTAAPATQAEPPPATASRALPFLVGGAGILFVGVGATFGLLAKGAYDDAYSLCGNKTGNCPDDAMSKRSTAGTFANISNVGFGLGVVGVAVGSYLLLRQPAPPPRAGHWQMTPVASQRGGGLLLDGNF